jgi:hypothetical protein
MAKASRKYASIARKLEALNAEIADAGEAFPGWAGPHLRLVEKAIAAQQIATEIARRAGEFDSSESEDEVQRMRAAADRKAAFDAL